MYRYWFIAFTALLLSACTAVTDEVRATVEYAFKSAEDAEMSPQKIKQFPYTSLYAQWQDQARALIVLGYVNKPDDWHFITADKETLVLRNGRVIRTQGLKDNVLSVSDLAGDPLNCVITSPANCDTHWQRQYDYKIKGQTLSRSVRSKFTVLKPVILDMPFGEVSATLVEEKGAFLLSEKAFTNRFWIEADGHVVKSEQQVFPDAAKLTLTQVTWIGRNYDASGQTPAQTSEENAE